MKSRRNFEPDYNKKVIDIYRKRKEQGLKDYLIAKRLGIQPQTLRVIVESMPKGDAA